MKLEDQLGMKDTQMAKLEKQEEEAHNHQMSLSEKEENLRSQKSAFDKLIAQQKEEERKRKEKQNNSNSSSNNSSSNNSGSSNNDSGSPEIEQTTSSSGFIKPAAGYISSGFGHRSCSGCSSYHPGVDIAQGGTVPVKAAASGIVSRSYFSSSYGNVVFVSHIIKGQKYTTVYAHMRNRAVSTGQTVSQGQYLGNMGNTGQSFGQHLHFEIHRGGWNYSKSNAVNPASFGIR